MVVDEAETDFDVVPEVVLEVVPDDHADQESCAAAPVAATTMAAEAVNFIFEKVRTFKRVTGFYVVSHDSKRKAGFTSPDVKGKEMEEKLEKEDSAKQVKEGSKE